MPGSDVPDYRTPSPDEGHEAIRRPLAAAIDDLARVVADLKQARLGVDDAYFVTDLLFGLVDTLLDQATNLESLLDAHRIRIDAVNIQADTALAGVDDLQGKVAALTERVTDLEASQAPLPGPDHAG